MLSHIRRELCSTPPPPASLVSTSAQIASTQFVYWTSVFPAQQVQYAQPIQYIIPSSHGNVQTQFAYIQPPPKTNHQVSQQQTNPQVFLTISLVVPSQNWYPDSGASHHVTIMS